MSRLRLGMLFSRTRFEEKLLIRAAERRRDVELVPLNTGQLVLDLGALPRVDVVLDREVIDATLAAGPTSTLRDVLMGFSERTTRVDVESDSVISDIDTLDDYERQRPG